MVKNIVRHGEVILKPIATLPNDAKLKIATKNYIVAHSETGHHHVLTTDLSDFKVFTLEGDTYVEVPELSKLIHEKSGKDSHAPHTIVPGIYKINIKKHFDYFKKAMANVRD